MAATLYGLHYSPWTERARWALEANGVVHTYREYVPMLGEPYLRWLARPNRGNTVSVPMLVDGPIRVCDSLAIMQLSDRRSRGPGLQAASDDAKRWCALIEPMVQAVRRRVSWRILRNDDAKEEAARAAVPSSLARFARPVAALGVRFIARKYGFDASAAEPDRGPIAEVLAKIRGALGDGPYIGDQFGAVDILVATALGGVSPHVRFFGDAPATRAMWTDDELAEQFADLVQWRDELYDKHRNSVVSHPDEGKVVSVV